MSFFRQGYLPKVPIYVGFKADGLQIPGNVGTIKLTGLESAPSKSLQIPRNVGVSNELVYGAKSFKNQLLKIK